MTVLDTQTRMRLAWWPQSQQAIPAQLRLDLLSALSALAAKDSAIRFALHELRDTHDYGNVLERLQRALDPD